MNSAAVANRAVNIGVTHLYCSL